MGIMGDERYFSKKSLMLGVAEAREVNGLPPIRKGIRKCLRCNKIFKSNNMKSNRICIECRIKNANDFSEDDI